MTQPVCTGNATDCISSGEPAYCGVSCFDGADYDTVYLGKQVSSIYEMQAWATTDNGATWAKITDITSSSTLGPNFRPVSPRNHTGRLACLWASGIYTTYINYRMNIHCYPPIIKEAYVKVPSVSGTVNTDIYCYYDNQAAADQEDAVNAWDSNFMAVYHLEERPAVATVLDSTTNARAGTKKAMIEPAYFGSLNFGNKSGQSFDGVDDYISLPTSINFASLTEVTVEVVGSYDGSGSSGDEHQFFSNWSVTAASIMIRAEPTAGGNTLEVFAIKATDTQVGGGIGATLSINTLHHIGAVYDATNLRAYINGTVGPTTYATGAAFDATASIAAYLGNTAHVATEQLTGYEEEVRISNVARSAAWLKATSINLRTPNSFYTYGTEEVAGYTVDLTAAALSFTAQNTQNTASATLTAPAFDFVAQDVTVANTGGGTAVTFDPATFDFVANDIQNTLRVELTTGTFDFAGLDVQPAINVTLSTAIFDFVARSITAGDPLAPTTGRATNMMLMGVGN